MCVAKCFQSKKANRRSLTAENKNRRMFRARASGGGREGVIRKTAAHRSLQAMVGGATAAAAAIRQRSTARGLHCARCWRAAFREPADTPAPYQIASALKCEPFALKCKEDAPALHAVDPHEKGTDECVAAAAA